MPSINLQESQYCPPSTPDLPGNKLTLDDLGLLVGELWDVCDDWYHLGLLLRVSIGALKRIQEPPFYSFTSKLMEMLKTWLTTADNTSWKTLIDALRCQSVGASQLANYLETKYCQVEDMQESKQLALTASKDKYVGGGGGGV